MQKIAEEQGFLKKPRKHLISSYFGEEILINTRMAKFFVELGLYRPRLGLKITRIQEFIQFFPMKCFDELSQEIVSLNISKKSILEKKGSICRQTSLFGA